MHWKLWTQITTFLKCTSDYYNHQIPPSYQGWETFEAMIFIWNMHLVDNVLFCRSLNTSNAILWYKLCLGVGGWRGEYLLCFQFDEEIVVLLYQKPAVLSVERYVNCTISYFQMGLFESLLSDCPNKSLKILQNVRWHQQWICVLLHYYLCGVSNPSVQITYSPVNDQAPDDLIEEIL